MSEDAEPDVAPEKGRVQVNYKSGISMIVECTEFTISRKSTGRTMEWTNDANPRPMFLGIDDIESVWQL